MPTYSSEAGTDTQGETALKPRHDELALPSAWIARKRSVV
jgi:hypothetical protein